MRNRTGLLVIGLAAAAAAGQARGQEAEAKTNLKLPVAFFSPSPTTPNALPPQFDNVYLRPNVRQSAYVFVYNPEDADRTVRVTLLDVTADGKNELGKSAPVLVPKNTCKRVPLAGPAAAPAAPAADGKAAPAPAGTRVRADKFLTLVTDVIRDDNKAAAAGNPNAQAFEVREPRQYVKLVSAEQTAKGFQVTLEYVAGAVLYSDAPARVKLDLRAENNPALALADRPKWTGTTEADLFLKPGTKTTLVVTNVTADGTAVVGVSVDGYDRAFLFTTDFKSTPTPMNAPSLAITPPAAKVKSGDPFTFRFEVLNPSAAVAAKTPLTLSVAPGGGTPQKLLVFDAPLQREARVSFGGPEDAVVFDTVFRDWTYQFPTTGVTGTVDFVTDLDGKASKKATLTIDDTRPTAVAFTDPFPTKDLFLGTEVTVEAKGTDDLSGIADALFYLGTPPGPDGKPAAGGKVVKGTLVKPAKVDGKAAEPDNPLAARTYKATFRLPETKGEVVVGVRFVNGVGLTADAEERTLYVVPKPEKEKEKDKLGTIEGTVVQGSRPQSLPVVLTDAAGKVIDTVESEKGTGKYKFKDVPPGVYAVSSQKKTDGAKGASDKPVKVEAGKTTTVKEINVLR